MLPNVQEILAGVRRLAVAAGSDVSLETLTAAAEFLPKLAKGRETELADLEQEAAALSLRITEARDLASRARGLLHGVEDAHKRLKNDHRQANAKAISGLQNELNMARAERGRLQDAHFPATSEQDSETARRWRELETELIPRLERELAALENVTF